MAKRSRTGGAYTEAPSIYCNRFRNLRRTNDSEYRCICPVEQPLKKHAPYLGSYWPNLGLREVSNPWAQVLVQTRGCSSQNTEDEICSTLFFPEASKGLILRKGHGRRVSGLISLDCEWVNGSWAGHIGMPCVGLILDEDTAQIMFRCMRWPNTIRNDRTNIINGGCADIIHKDSSMRPSTHPIATLIHC